MRKADFSCLLLNIALRFSGGVCGDFDKNKEFLINVNLQKILGNVGDAKDFHFSVLNGSKKQQKNLNPDGTTSDE